MGMKRSISLHSSEPPAKKQSKWSPEEDSLIIELRGRQMKWEDISKRLPGRSAISCRLHYQNYLERRSEWDEERKNKLARIYERFKPEIWAKVAEEMAVPWRAAEAMHWQLGETEMARRAGVTPFSLSSGTADTVPSLTSRRTPPNRGRSLSQNQALVQTLNVDSRIPNQFSSPPRQIYGSVRTNSLSPQSSNQSHKIASKYACSTSSCTTVRRESTPRSFPSTSPTEGVALAAITNSKRGVGQQVLPSVAEMTTGVSPYVPSTYATPEGVEYAQIGSSSPSTSITQSPYINKYYQRWPELHHQRQSSAGYFQEMRQQ
ncbi:putative myb dna-binding domain protein [Erysiphe neolycopersici]|uniref:Putative myb dna-binding domain protein n=1 Tax=Erysiphe neolycopersici TaxID=212602 RepID=A0A420HLQ4_9PEZI|nr:putative myb dna-binding domain protein [Erysiphe neolycopersici]